MIRFGRDEYIRNFWFNLCIIMLMAVMMIISTILVSNMEEETDIYKLAEKYMDDDSMFLNNVESKYMEELETYGEVLSLKVFDGRYEEDEDYPSIRTIVYTEEQMKYVKPMLDLGKYADESQKGDKIIKAIISYNPYGIKVGDTFTYNIYTADSYLPVKVYVTGIISDGQRLYTDLTNIFYEMTYEDFFPIYSYEQTEHVRLIITEEELEKIPEVKGFLYNSNIIINPRDDLSVDEKNAIWEKIINYEIDYAESGIISRYPEAKVLVEKNDILYKSIIIKYFPLCIIIILLFIISIIGIITIKNAKSIRYYGIMYTYGMQYRDAEWLVGLEMVFNSIMAVMITVTLLSLQKNLNIVGKINCKIDGLEVLVMLGICMITVVGSVLITRGILKEHTPVEILKNKI